MIPTPATTLGRCSGRRSVKPVSKTKAGSDDWSITSTSHQFRIRSSNTRSNPLSAGRLRVRVPSDPPNLSERSSVFRALGAVRLAPWDQEAAGGNPAVPTNLGSSSFDLSLGSADRSAWRPFKELPWPKTRGIRLLIGTMRVGVLPAAPITCIARW